MKKLTIVLVGALALASVALVACGGDGGDDEETPEAGGTRASQTGTSGARTSGTPGNETAAAGQTAGAGTTPGASGGSPAAGQTGAAGSNPAPGTTPSAGAMPGENTAGLISDELPPTPSQAERTGTDGVSQEDLDNAYGGDPNEPQTVVTDLPERPAGASTDPTTIADPQPDAGGVELIIDLNASEPGIQSTRTVNVGDIFRVGVVLANVPDEGLAAFNFMMRYDIGTIIAPTVMGGSSIARNPDLNEGALGGGDSNWSCAPPGPEGDADEPGAAIGDGDPATGQAYISCFNPLAGSYASGHLVIATVLFQATASGTTVLDFEAAQSFSPNAEIGGCGGNNDSMPCRTATLTVQ